MSNAMEWLLIFIFSVSLLIWGLGLLGIALLIVGMSDDAGRRY